MRSGPVRCRSRGGTDSRHGHERPDTRAPCGANFLHPM